MIPLIFFQAVLIVNIIDFTPLAFDEYVLPGWAQFLGWGMAVVSIIVIPIFAVAKIILSFKDPTYDGLSLPRVRSLIIVYKLIDFGNNQSLVTD